jgi:hypothetical protein
VPEGRWRRAAGYARNYRKSLMPRGKAAKLYGENRGERGHLDEDAVLERGMEQYLATYSQRRHLK